jgi:Flagellar protein FliT
MSREILQSMLDISTHMLESAETENWAEVESLQDIRTDLITQIFSQPINEHDKSFCATVLEKTLDINQTLARLCQKQRDEVSQEIIQLRQGKKLKSTYDTES